MWMPAGWADKCVINLVSLYELARAKTSVPPQPPRSAFHSVSSSTCGFISRVVRLDCLNSGNFCCLSRGGRAGRNPKIFRTRMR